MQPESSEVERVSRGFESLGELMPEAKDAREALCDGLSSEIRGLSAEASERILASGLAALRSELSWCKPSQRNTLGRIKGALSWLEPLAGEAGRLAQKTIASGACSKPDSDRADEIERLLEARLVAVKAIDALAAQGLGQAFGIARASCEATRTCGERLGPAELFAKLRVSRPPAEGATHG